MRPRIIPDAPGLDRELGAFDRFERFARMIVTVPKAEAEREMGKSGLRKKPSADRKRKIGNGENKNKTEG